MDEYRLWSFIADMNNSGGITIVDLWLWFKWLFFYPGDYVVNLFIYDAGTEPEFKAILDFFEIPRNDWFGGWISGIASLYIWQALLQLLGSISLFLFSEEYRKELKNRRLEQE